MSFPDADQAIASQDKICEYLLNHNHPVGGAKAAWFAARGYSLLNWAELRDDLLRIARTCKDFVALPSPFGVKYLTTGVVGRGGGRSAKVLVVWMIEGNSPPRLITAFPGDDS